LILGKLDQVGDQEERPQLFPYRFRFGDSLHLEQDFVRREFKRNDAPSPFEEEPDDFGDFRVELFDHSLLPQAPFFEGAQTGKRLVVRRNGRLDFDNRGASPFALEIIIVDAIPECGYS